MFTVLLDDLASAHDVRAYAVHPGSIAGTELAREAPLELFQQMGFVDEKGDLLPEVAASLKTIPQGAATTVWCAASPLLAGIGGVYCEDGDIAPLAADDGIAIGVKAYSLDETSAKRLWELTESMTGIHFGLD